MLTLFQLCFNHLRILISRYVCVSVYLTVCICLAYVSIYLLFFSTIVVSQKRVYQMTSTVSWECTSAWRWSGTTWPSTWRSSTPTSPTDRFGWTTFTSALCIITLFKYVTLFLMFLFWFQIIDMCLTAPHQLGVRSPNSSEGKGAKG